MSLKISYKKTSEKRTTSLQGTNGLSPLRPLLEVLLHCVTQGYFEENPEELLTAEDSQGNTIAHMVAASGNTEVFEV